MMCQMNVPFPPLVNFWPPPPPPSPNCHSELLFIIPYIFLLTCTEINDFKFFPFFIAKILHSYFYKSYVSICKDLQKTIVSSSGPFIQFSHLQNNVFLIYHESKAVSQRPSHDRVSQKNVLTGEHLPQKRDSNKAAAMHLYWNHTSACVPPPPVD